MSQYIASSDVQPDDATRRLMLPAPGAFVWYIHQEGSTEHDQLSFKSLTHITRTIKTLMRRASPASRDKYRNWMRGGCFIPKQGELTGAAIRALRGADEGTQTRNYNAGINDTPDDFCQWLFAKLINAKKTPSVDETLYVLAIFFTLTYLLIKRSPDMFTSNDLVAGGFVDSTLKAVLLVKHPDPFLTVNDFAALAYGIEIETELGSVDALLAAAANESTTASVSTRPAVATEAEKVTAKAQSTFDQMIASEASQEGDRADLSAQMRLSMSRSARLETTRSAAAKPEQKVRYSAAVVTQHVRYVLDRIADKLNMTSIFRERQNTAGLHMWLCITGNAPSNALGNETYCKLIEELLMIGNLTEAVLETYGGTETRPEVVTNLSDLVVDLKTVRDTLARSHEGTLKITSSDVRSMVVATRNMAATDGSPSSFSLLKRAEVPNPLVFRPNETGQTAFFSMIKSEWTRTIQTYAATWAALFNPSAARSLLASARAGEQKYVSTITDLTLREEQILAMCTRTMRIFRSSGVVFDFVYEIKRNPANGDAQLLANLRQEEAAYGVGARERVEANEAATRYERTLFITDARRALVLGDFSWPGSNYWPSADIVKESLVDGRTWVAVSEAFGRYVHTKAALRETLTTQAGTRTSTFVVDLNQETTDKLEPRSTIVTTVDEYGRQRNVAIFLYSEAAQALLHASTDLADVRLRLTPIMRALFGKSILKPKAETLVVELAGVTRVLHSVAGRAATFRVWFNLEFQYARLFSLVNPNDASVIVDLDPGIFRHLAITIGAS